MSDVTLRTTPAGPRGLRSIFDWLRQAGVAARLADEPVPSRDAALLDDIGLTADQVGRIVDRGNTEIGLLGLGWQQPGRDWRR